MNNQWFVHSGVMERDWIQKIISIYYPSSHITYVSQSKQLRSLIKTLDLDNIHIAIGDGSNIDPINLAGALLKDGHDLDIVIVTNREDENFMKRAKELGIKRVICASDADVAVLALQDQVTEGAPLCENTTLEKRPGSVTIQDKTNFISNLGAQIKTVDEHTLPPLDEPASTKDETDDTNPKLSPLRARANSGAVDVNKAPIISLVSGRGGVGKSTIACTMALLASEWKMDVALVDGDLTFGNIYGFFSLPSPLDISPIKDGVNEATLHQIGRRVTENLTLFGPSELPEYAEYAQGKMGAMLDYLSSEFDLVIVDTSSGWPDSVAEIAQKSNRMAIVSDERAGAISSLARVAALGVRLGVARTRIMRIMNRCDIKRRDEGFMARANLGLETARVYKVLEGGREIPEFMSCGSVKELIKIDNSFVLSVKNMLARVLDEMGRLPENDEAKRALKIQIGRKHGKLHLAKEAA